MIIPWLQDDEGAKAYGQPGSEYACIKDESTLNEINNYKQFYLPNGKVIDLEGKYKASGFYTSKDVTLPGALYSIRIDGVDYLHAYKPGTQITLGFSTPDKSASIKIESFKTMDDSDQAVKVLVNGEIINIKSSGTDKQITFDGKCECLKPDSEFEDIYFATSKTSQPYIEFFKTNSKKINHSIADETGIVNGLVESALAVKNQSNIDAALFGEELADKLNTYELLNSGRKFIIAPLLVETLSANQDSWQAIAQKVFQQANLSENDILVTMPYVHCPGIGFDLGEYYFMPGLAKGGNINIDLTGLRTDYTNTHNVASFITDNTRSSLWEYIKDVLKNTEKKCIKRYYYITAKGEITGRIEEIDGHTGFPGTIDFRLVVDGRFKTYSDLVARINKNVFLESKKPANKSEHIIAAFNKTRTDLENQYDNFFIDNSEPEDFIVNHGLKEYGCISNESVCKQFVLWYRDFVYATTESETSPSDDCFFIGKNQVVYDATLEQIEAFGLILAPFNFDWVADGIGFFYSGYYCDFPNMSLYGTAFFIPVITTGIIKGSSKALLNGLRSGESEIVEEGGEYLIRWIAKDNLGTIPDELLDSWKILNNKAKSYIKNDIARLEVFNKLSTDNQKLISQFTDVDANSTLAKFLDDCKADPDFLNYVNDPGNSLTVKGFLSHKTSVKETLTTDELNYFGDLIKSSDEISNPNIRKWLEHSDNINTLRKYADEGIAFGNRIKGELTSSTSEAYSVLKQRLADLEPALDINDYSIYSQVQLCLKGDCIKKGEYWIPDFLLIAERQGPAGKYFETIVVDSKLSRGTSWTPNQIEADKMPSWKIKSVSKDNIINGIDYNLTNQTNLIRNGKFVKLFEESGVLKTEFK